MAWSLLAPVVVRAQQGGFAIGHGSCKGLRIGNIQLTDTVTVDKKAALMLPGPVLPKDSSVPFLQVHGNVLYDVNYYSRIDTPYSEKNVYQHTIQTYLDVLFAGKYPMRVYLTNRFSNTKLFKNFSDFNLSYNNNRFKQLIQDQMWQHFLQSIGPAKDMDSLQQVLEAKRKKLQGLNNWLGNPSLTSRIIEARERLYFKAKDSLAKLGQPDMTAFTWPANLSYDPKTGWKNVALPEDKKGSDSTAQQWTEAIDQKKRAADSLRQQIAVLQQLLQTKKQWSQSELGRIHQDISQLDNPTQLKKELDALHISDSSLPKGYKTLMAVQSFGIGRNVLSYSELSVKNISVNGVEAAYKPKDYYAIATGTVDYRFRDFVVQNSTQGGQYLTVLRYGKEFSDGRNIILTYFTGRRQLYNSSTSDTSQTQQPSAQLMGFTLESNFRITRDITLTGEVAKSSMPGYADSAAHRSSINGLFQASERSNEAYSLKLNAFVPGTLTRIKAAYKKLGVNYQSFSVFTDGSAQNAWSVNVNQLLFKRQLELNAGVSTNDFSNPLLNSSYKSTTLFKSIQATLRKPLWPVISLGYFPSSQLTKLGDGQYMENLFYTMVGNVSYAYRYQGTLMNTMLMYTQFYNRASDSGFTYFNTKNVLLSHSIFLNKFTLQANASGAYNQDYNLYTFEGKVQHKLSSLITVGAGAKYNVQSTYEVKQWGYSGEALLNFPKLGQFQLSAEKGFFPGMNKELVPNNTGRLSYFKIF